MTTFGTMAWATATSGGQLGAFDRLAQLWLGVQFRLRSKLHRQAPLLGVSPADVERMVAELELPNTPLVARAAALVEELGPPALANHAMRTWAWGSVLGLRDGLTWDRETFAIAALLHDLALARRTPAVTCFAADGATQAMELLRTWGAAENQRRVVGDAICMHVRIAIPPALGVEAHLVNAGAAVDVVGARLDRIAPAVRTKVLERHPRLGLEDFLVETFRREADANPRSRMALWVSLGFLDRIARTRTMFERQ